MVTLYGIRNCDSVRKARRWLADHRIAYRFHDLREDGITSAMLDAWIRELGWEPLLNRRGTTWRQLTERQRTELDPGSARKLMLTYPALIKRPLLDTGTGRYVGFNDESYKTLFSRDSHESDP